MPKVTGRALFSGVMFSLGAFLLAHSYSVADLATAASFGPQFFPRIILWVWLLLAACMTVEAMFLKGKQDKGQHWAGLLSAVALTGLACLLLPLAGFLPVSLIFMLAYPWALGYRRVTILVPLAVLFSLATWYVFNEILLIPLPEVPWLP